MKTKNTTTTTETHRLLSAHHDESAARLKKLQDRLTTTTPENKTPAPLPDWMEWVEERPIICGLIAAAIGIAGGWIFGANI